MKEMQGPGQSGSSLGHMQGQPQTPAIEGPAAHCPQDTSWACGTAHSSALTAELNLEPHLTVGPPAGARAQVTRGSEQEPHPTVPRTSAVRGPSSRPQPHMQLSQSLPSVRFWAQPQASISPSCLGMQRTQPATDLWGCGSPSLPSLSPGGHRALQSLKTEPSSPCQ